MKPLVVLLITFAVALIAIKSVFKEYNLPLSGRIALSVMLVFTAVGHFVYTKGMAMMLPEVMPYRTEVVYVTGVLELLAAITLMIPRWQGLTSWLLIVFFVCILPANILAALRHIDYQKATMTGSGLNYLWFRIPLQVFFIGWTYFFGIR